MISKQMNKQLEAWRSDLIDFSRRNNLLNQDSRTVKIVFSNPAADYQKGSEKPWFRQN
jgi:DNA gyrase inhibitor GyrI